MLFSYRKLCVPLLLSFLCIEQLHTAEPKASESQLGLVDESVSVGTLKEGVSSLPLALLRLLLEFVGPCRRQGSWKFELPNNRDGWCGERQHLSELDRGSRGRYYIVNKEYGGLDCLRGPDDPQILGQHELTKSGDPLKVLDPYLYFSPNHASSAEAGWYHLIFDVQRNSRWERAEMTCPMYKVEFATEVAPTKHHTQPSLQEDSEK